MPKAKKAKKQSAKAQTYKPYRNRQPKWQQNNHWPENNQCNSKLPPPVYCHPPPVFNHPPPVVGSRPLNPRQNMFQNQNNFHHQNQKHYRHPTHYPPSYQPFPQPNNPNVWNSQIYHDQSFNNYENPNYCPQWTENIENYDGNMGYGNDHAIQTFKSSCPSVNKIFTI